jgi:hypothetical protein
MLPSMCFTPGYALDSTLGQGWSFSSPHAQREWQAAGASSLLGGSISEDLMTPVPVIVLCQLSAIDHADATGHHYWVQLLPKGEEHVVDAISLSAALPETLF